MVEVFVDELRRMHVSSRPHSYSMSRTHVVGGLGEVGESWDGEGLHRGADGLLGAERRGNVGRSACESHFECDD